MPELYRQWSQQGIVFHYVSGSPWQLYVPLAEFFRAQRLPVASIDLKYVRLKDPSTLDLLQSQDMKLLAIESILRAFPRRRFILIGDSGEQDPETYAQIARTHGPQIVAIFIRNITQEQADNARIGPLRQGLDGVRFHLFEDPAELQPIMDEIGGATTADPETPSP
jgi:phosphatidate phosphatase APP1